MTPTEVPNPRSEAELEKAIKLELLWLISDDGLHATLLEIRRHQCTLAHLFADLKVERFVGSQKRVPDNKQSRSWHR